MHFKKRFYQTFVRIVNDFLTVTEKFDFKVIRTVIRTSFIVIFPEENFKIIFKLT